MSQKENRNNNTNRRETSRRKENGKNKEGREEGKSDWLRPLRTFGIKKEREYFLENFAMLVSSGMSIFKALASIHDDLETKRMQRAVSGIKDRVESGSPLWRAFEDSGIFPPHVISLVRIGEDSGQLPENLEIVARQQKKERVFRSKLYTAMMYPVFVLGLTLLVGIGVAWFILPNLANVFASLRMELPTITQWLINLGEFLGAYGVYVVPALLVFIFLVVFLVFIFPPTKFIGQAILFRLPGTKRLIREVEIARFGYLLGSLLEAGIVVTEALDSLSNATTFPSYQRLYEHMRDHITEGNSFQKSFASFDGADGLIPPPIQGMVVAGEQSGNLPDTLTSIGETFEEKLDTTAKSLTVILEPILLFVVWTGVVAVALAVILPIYSLIGGLNEGPRGGGASSSPPPAQEEEMDSDSPATSTPVGSSATSTLATSTPEAGEPAATSSKRLEITETGIGYLNVRSGPGTNNSIIAEVNPGDTFGYLNTNGFWYEIVLDDGETGWVFGEYVNEINQDEAKEEQ